ncbi:MAG: hypothetical protein IPL70_01255 [Uliginosibacterium sp.]|nr:hypothetical protein [Uliginosibacterium sp.]
MKPENHFNSCSRNRQSGAALVVGLVVLVLLTLLGIAAMRTSALEERMAGNLRESNIAFQSAEGALREAIASNLPAKPYDGTKAGLLRAINNFLMPAANRFLSSPTGRSTTGQPRQKWRSRGQASVSNPGTWSRI